MSTVEFFTNSETVYYGDVSHRKTQECFLESDPTEDATLKTNKRKPTDIVVYTDSFCYSCCSIITKGIKEQGSAIVVGFWGDPTKEGIDNFEVVTR